MGDSGFAVQFSLLILVFVVGAIVAFLIAWCVRKRSVRFLVGVILLAGAAACNLFSVLAALLVTILGATALILAIKTPAQENSA